MIINTLSLITINVGYTNNESLNLLCIYECNRILHRARRDFKEDISR